MANFIDQPDDRSIPVSPDQERSSLRPLVLVVEDHDDTRTLYRFVLEMHGYEVVEAAKGEDAICLAEELRPDLVLMDTNLPEIDGLMATRYLRNQASLRNLPIIFISGNAQPELRAAALAAGGNDYLVKPMSISDLEASVEKHLAKGRNSSPAVLRANNNRHPRRRGAKLPLRS